MSGNTEPTSNSMKFAPMPMSALFAQFMPRNDAENSDSDSVDENDNSFGVTVTTKQSRVNQLQYDEKSPPISSNVNLRRGFISQQPFRVNQLEHAETSPPISSNANLRKGFISKQPSSVHQLERVETSPPISSNANLRKGFISKQPSSVHELEHVETSLPISSNANFNKQFISQQPSLVNQLKLVEASTAIASNAKCMKGFISENILNESNKENQSNTSMSNNWKYSINDGQDLSKEVLLPPSVNKHVFSKPPNSEIPRSCHAMTPLAVHTQKHIPHKKTPDQQNITNSSQKSKAATPKLNHIKSGIRRFTPSSGRHSNRKPLQKKALQQTSNESVRCLFPDNQTKEESSCPISTQQPAQETPQQKPLPILYAATPSYPQGAIPKQSKTFTTIMIKGKNYLCIKRLGTGGSSVVYKVLEVGTSSEYAVKFVHLGTDPELARGYRNEVKLLKALQNSDRVVRLYDYEYYQDKQLRVVMEVGETDLSSVLKASGADLPIELILFYWVEMLHAVHYIHNHGVIHADLKPANFVLVCGRLKLIDFGIASSISSDATSVVRSQATGTYSYISPEALMGGAGGYSARSEGNEPIKISYRSDVWSLGCILYSMVYRHTPFSHIPNLAKLAAILDPNHRIDFPPLKHVPSSLTHAMKWCLTYNMRARPTVRELLAIPYIPIN